MSDDDERPDGDEFDDGLPDGVTYGDFLRSQLDVMSQQSGDYLLRVLVEVANQGSLSFDVTLTIGGTLVCGQLISGATYFDEIATAVDASAGGRGIALSLPFRSIRDHYYAEGLLGAVAADIERVDDDAAQQHPTSPLPTFIHLKDTVVWHGQRDASIGFWRGRISEVQGWSVGRLSQPS